MPSSASASITRYLEETVAGTIETENPQIYRVTGGALAQTTEASGDNELRSDRGVGDSTLVSGSVGGSLEVNYSHKTHIDFLEALLANVGVPVDTDGFLAVVDAVFTQSTHTLSSATTVLPDLAKGQWFQITGSSGATNDGIFKCSDSVEPTTAAIVVDTQVKDFVDATVDSATLSCTRITQAYDALRSFSIEREMSDITPAQFLMWKGCYVSSLSLNYALGEKLSGSFGFLGSESEVQAATTSLFTGLATGGVAATTTPYFNTVTGTSVLLDGTAMGDSCIESLTIDIQGNLRERRCIGAGLAASSIALDPFKISFTSNIYFGTTASAALYAKKIADTALTFTVCLSDSSGNGFALTMPRCKITEATIDAGGIGSDVMMSLNADAVTDSTDATMLHIDLLGSTA